MALRYFTKFNQFYLNNLILRSSSISANVFNKGFVTLSNENSNFLRNKTCTNFINLQCEQKRYKYDKKGSAKRSAVSNFQLEYGHYLLRLNMILGRGF